MIAKPQRVPQGYKQTEVGLIPVDWRVIKLGDHAVFKTGPFGSTLHKSDYVDGGVPVVNPMQIVDGKLVPTPTMAISEAAAQKLAEFRLRTGNVVIGRRGDMGRCAVVGSAEDGWICGTGSVAIRPLNSISSGFLQRQLASPLIVNAIESTSVGTTMINLNQGTLSNLSIPSPPTLAEQEAIAEALGDADAWIESLEQLVAKKRHLKQAAMHQLLKPRSTWREASLLELADGHKSRFDDGDWIESEHITSEGIRLVQTGNIGSGNFVEKDPKKFIFEDSFQKLHCKEIFEGDLLLCRLAEPAGRACVLPDIGEHKIVTSVDVTIFRPRKEVANRSFLANLFSTDRWFRQVLEMVGGTTHKRISRGSLGRIQISIPSIEEQNDTADVFNTMDAEIEAVEAKLAKARQIKQGMMQELLTGRIRLV